MGAEVGGADRRGEVRSEGQIGDVEVQSEGQIGGAEVQSEGRIGGAEVRGRGAAGALNRRSGRSNGGWMEAVRHRIPGAAAAALSSSSLSLPLSRFGALQGWGVPAREVYALDPPPGALPATLFPRVHSHFSGCAVSASTNWTP